SGSSLLPLLPQSGADVLSVDWRVSLSDVRRTIPKKSSVKALQGNLDPAALFLPKRELIKAVRAVFEDNGGHPGHIFNLGHGVLPRTPLASVETVISTVHSLHPIDNRPAR
ncbi:MAG: uroporphyrinogen decarboxylase family protein, partial [bacterium]